MKCSEADAFIHAYVDGELAGVDRDAYEQHLVQCDGCSRACRLQARFKAAVRGHLPRPSMPMSLQRRLTAALDDAPPARRVWPWERFPRLVPAVTAAVALGAVLFTVRSRRSPMLEQALRTYATDVPMDVVDTNCASVANWFRGKVDFAVPPTRLERVANCRGGRLINVPNGLAAWVVYEGPSGRRLGMLVLPDDDAELDGERRVVGGRDVYFGRGRGVGAAAVREHGLTYILTTDDESALPTVLEAVLRQ